MPNHHLYEQPMIYYQVARRGPSAFAAGDDTAAGTILGGTNYVAVYIRACIRVFARYRAS